ncbi:hypothetical protein I302_108617 [Kwoniella bestiolae CBS 10118]|uniref:Uncharacterized protein n=1 Tax=Kwoniella bestiolae CBS 10118 TaxID=1296100 RepID=A0A1B9FTM1_9TREE|nr:hypothetical protein I302_07755 [Kwoniella bestiolae CBS 10118]OCF22113.1 hypothetical protein I302_07755 [Kwoniella bestiolae CBS 10118]
MNPNNPWGYVGGYQYGNAFPPTPPMSPQTQPNATGQNQAQAQGQGQNQAANTNPSANFPGVLMPNPSTPFGELTQPDLSPANGWTSVSPYQRHPWITPTTPLVNTGQPNFSSFSAYNTYQAPPTQTSSSNTNADAKHWECATCDTRRNETDETIWCHKCRNYTKTMWVQGA